jgi:hypothetical protein
MKNKAFFTLLLITATFAANAQKLIATETIDSTTFVSASVSNLKTMLQMQLGDWENALKKLGYGSQSNSSDNETGINVFLVKNSVRSGCMNTLIKTDVSISIDWSGLRDIDKVFKKLKTELAPYYKGVQGDSPVYLIKEGGVTYQYVIVKYEGGETVIIRRH